METWSCNVPPIRGLDNSRVKTHPGVFRVDSRIRACCHEPTPVQFVSPIGGVLLENLHGRDASIVHGSMALSWAALSRRFTQ